MKERAQIALKKCHGSSFLRWNKSAGTCFSNSEPPRVPEKVNSPTVSKAPPGEGILPTRSSCADVTLGHDSFSNAKCHFFT